MIKEPLKRPGGKLFYNPNKKYAVTPKMKKIQIFMLLALLLITVFTFYPALNAGFVNLDDPAMVTHNWKIRSFGPDNLKALLLEPHFKLYHPLVNLSYAAQYRFFKLDPYYYHAGNLMLHMLNALLVFFIFFRLSGRNFAVSFITSFLFSCHPMHVEPVAWVSARKDTLYAFFFLSSWLFYLKARCAEGKKKFFAVSFSLLLFLFACLSKSMAVTLPAVLVLCDWFSGLKFNARSFLRYLPYFFIAAVFSLGTFLLYYTPGQKNVLTLYFLFVNFVSAHFNMLFYLVKFLVPSKLSVIYPHFFENTSVPPDFILKAPAMVYALALLAAYSLKKTKLVCFGLGLFLITVLPVINILPAGVSPVADRYTYIPFIGLGYAVSGAILSLYAVMKKAYAKNLMKTAVFACLAAMCLSAHARAGKWKNTKTLFSDVIENYPATLAKAYSNRGNCFRIEGNIKEAEKDFQMALFLEPDDNETLYDLAFLRVDEKKYDEALTFYDRLPYDDHNIEGVYMFAAKIYYEKGRKEKAYRIIENGIKRFPRIFYLYETLAIFQAYDGNYEKATENLTKAKELHISNPELYLYQMQIYDILGRYSEAEAELKTGIANCAKNADLMRKLGELYLDYNEYAKASVQFMHTVKKYPGDYIAYNYLGDIEKQAMNHKKALYYYTLALLIKNDYAPAYAGRAGLYLETGNFDKFMRDILTAEKLGAEIPDELKKEIKQKTQ